MGHYSDRRIRQTFRINFASSGGATVADNFDLATIRIPANREVEIYSFTCRTQVKNTTASGKIELVDSSNNILASVTNTHTDATIAQATQTLPVTFKNGATADVIKIRSDQIIAATTHIDVELVMSDPGVG